nr:unnamed protein product [Callosobruchus analis]
MNTTDWNRPLTDHELDEIINAPDFYDTPSDCSGSEVDDHEKYESAEDSGREYVSSTDDNDVDDPQPGPSKKARKTEMQNEARDTQQIDDNVGSSETQQPPTSQVSLKGKNGHRWSAVAGETSRIPMKNKTHIIQGPKDIAQKASNPLVGFSLFISDTMIDEIVIPTNNEIHVKSQNYTQEKSTTSLATSIEIKALIGSSIFSSELKNNHLSRQELSATMSRERNKFLINCLRFHDKTTRGIRKETDPLAAERVIWDQLIENCRNYYKAGSYITNDEQLLALRGRCTFRMHIPNNGLKIVIVCDTGTKYMIDASPYLGSTVLPALEIICIL